MSSASYREFVYAIAPGATQVVNRQGDFFHVLSANQTFKVGWDDDELSPFRAGLEYEARNGRVFRKTLIENTSGAVLNITCGVGRGGIRDGRFTVSGPLDARDNGGASFDEVVAAVAAANWLDLTGYTVAHQTATTTFVTGAANTNGIDVLYTQLLTLLGNADVARLKVDGKILGSTWKEQNVVLPRLRIPAGQSLQFEAVATAAISIAYKVL